MIVDTSTHCSGHNHAAIKQSCAPFHIYAHTYYITRLYFRKIYHRILKILESAFLKEQVKKRGEQQKKEHHHQKDPEERDQLRKK